MKYGRSIISTCIPDAKFLGNVLKDARKSGFRPPDVTIVIRKIESGSKIIYDQWRTYWQAD